MAPSHPEDEKSGNYNEKSSPSPSPTPKRASFFFSKKKQHKEDDDSESAQAVEPVKAAEPLLQPVSFTQMFKLVPPPPHRCIL